MLVKTSSTLQNLVHHQYFGIDFHNTNLDITVEKPTADIKKFKHLYLKQNETVELFVAGYIGNALGNDEDPHYSGTLILTNERVVFFHNGEFGDILKTVSFETITTLQRKAFLGHRTLKINTQNSSLTFKTFSREQAVAVYDYLSAQLFHTNSSVVNDELQNQ
jgi:hypothetical protein